MIKNVAKNVFLVGTEHFCQYVVFEGDECILLDGGISGQYPILKKDLENLRLNPQLLLVLHAHFDHMMSFPLLQGEVLVPRDSVKFLEDREVLRKIHSMDRFVSNMFRRAMGINRVEQKPFVYDKTFENGDVFQVGSKRLIAVDAKGHSPDSMAFFLEEDGILFVSDAMGVPFSKESIYRPNYFYSLGEFLKTLDRLEALDPSVICLGHTGVIERDRVKDAFREAREGTRAFMDEVLSLLEKIRDEGEVARILYEKYTDGFLEFFPRESTIEFWKILVKRTKEYVP